MLVLIKTVHVPETVILATEPLDIKTMSLKSTATIQAKVDCLIRMVLKELDRLGAGYQEKSGS